MGYKKEISVSKTENKRTLRKDKPVYRPSKTHKRVSSGTFGILTGLVLVGIGLMWIVVTKKLIDINGFGFGAVVNYLPYVGMATVVLGVVILIYAIGQATRSVTKKNEEEIEQTSPSLAQASMESNFSKNRIKGVIFDLDGTLLDTLTDLTNATNEALEKHRYAHITPSDMKKLIGNGLYNVVRQGLPQDTDPEKIQAIYQDLVSAYERQFMDFTLPYQGVIDLMNELYSRGYLLAVLSNKKEEFTKALIQEFFPEIRFVDVVGESPRVPRKPDPTSAKMIADAMMLPLTSVVLVGDSKVDMMTAKNANMTAVGVSWGFSPVEQLKDYGMDYYLSEPKDLIDLLRLLNKKQS